MTKTVSRVLAMAAVTSALAFPGAALASVDYSFLDDLSLDELTALQEEIDLRVEAGQADANANDVEDFGIWNIRYFVDEFDRPTDDGYVIALTKDGYFSNSATTRSDLTAQVMFEPLASDVWYMQIFLYEYNRSQVLGSWKTVTYDVTILDGNGEKHHFTATLPEDGDRIGFSLMDTDEIMGIFSNGGTVSIKLQDQDDSRDSYLMTFDDCARFDNACNKLLVDSGFISDAGDSIDDEVASEEPAAEAGALTDGEYAAEGKGIGGTVPVTVTVKDGKVATVTVGENSETFGIGSNAIEQLPGAIVEANGTEGVDAVAGATVTSKAIFSAVDEALEQAKA
ncbi:MAG: FMN-binding protein [Coriobacteriales bacterium]|nr:FMN-binding protein [Coriobacteriales bacterium]